MPEVTLSPDQSRVLDNALEPVALRDAAGKVIGYIQPELTREEIAEAKRSAAAPGPRISLSRALSNLSKIQQVEDSDGRLTGEQMRDMMYRLRDEDQP